MIFMSQKRVQPSKNSTQNLRAKKPVNQQLFLWAFVLPSMLPLMLVPIFMLSLLLYYDVGIPDELHKLWSFSLVISPVAAAIGLIYLTGRQKKRQHVISLLMVPVSGVLLFVLFYALGWIRVGENWSVVTT